LHETQPNTQLFSIIQNCFGGCRRRVVGWFMVFYEQLTRILAAVVLIVAFAVPSLAFAYEGHQAPSAAKVVSALSKTQAVKKVAVAVADVAALSTARASVPVAVGVFTDCGGHCCGGAAGMACCGAALAADPCSILLFEASLLFLIRDVPPPRGISPEALPKPPTAPLRPEHTATPTEFPRPGFRTPAATT
jgi:hypothetical protein